MDEEDEGLLCHLGCMVSSYLLENPDSGLDDIWDSEIRSLSKQIRVSPSEAYNYVQRIAVDVSEEEDYEYDYAYKDLQV